jgi:hypothetical protein
MAGTTRCKRRREKLTCVNICLKSGLELRLHTAHHVIQGHVQNLLHSAVLKAMLASVRETYLLLLLLLLLVLSFCILADTVIGPGLLC